MREGTVLASVEVAESFRARTRGLLGRDGLDGALLIRPARSVHSLLMRFPLDVAFCDRDLRVIDLVRLRQNRLTRPRFGARCIIEAEAGAFDFWELQAGDQLELAGEEAV